MDAAMRVGAACMMTAASAWGGRMLAGTQTRRMQALEEALHGVRRLQVEMLDRRLPVKEALAACPGALFAAVSRAMEGGSPPGTAFGAAEGSLSARGGPLDSLTGGDLAALRRLFSGLGENGVEPQRLRLHESAEELERLLGEARRKREEHGRLYTSLGALVGLAAALLLL